jgi:hypothetical protein
MQAGRIAFDNLDVLVEGLGTILLMPGNPIVSLQRRRQWTKNHAGMSQAFDPVKSWE